ncbi:MarR family transcriptional regulator [Streptomyces sp. NBC_01224]|uniref:MarR family winged helix-turn-helix transcriptional regulator n=1 Tax=Streptomyces sp. NBC_01224 TaxID=2903783 RepID=UPI002E1003DF|nr:MarR family transcriptional regulator [Streptomyces sp. NBC_01224]
MSEHEAKAAVDGRERVGLHFLSVAYQVREKVDQRMTAAGLSLSRTKVLQLLARRGALHQAELAEALGQAPRSVTQTVEALERDGFITRASDTEDRRRKTVSLTATGQAALATAEQAGEQILQQLFGSLDIHQLARLERLLDLVNDAATGAT